MNSNLDHLLRDRIHHFTNLVFRQDKNIAEYAEIYSNLLLSALERKQTDTSLSLVTKLNNATVKAREQQRLGTNYINKALDFSTGFTGPHHRELVPRGSSSNAAIAIKDPRINPDTPEAERPEFVFKFPLMQEVARHFSNTRDGFFALNVNDCEDHIALRGIDENRSNQAVAFRIHDGLDPRALQAAMQGVDPSDPKAIKKAMRDHLSDINGLNRSRELEQGFKFSDKAAPSSDTAQDRDPSPSRGRSTTRSKRERSRSRDRSKSRSRSKSRDRKPKEDTVVSFQDGQKPEKTPPEKIKGILSQPSQKYDLASSGGLSAAASQPPVPSQSDNRGVELTEANINELTPRLLNHLPQIRRNAENRYRDLFPDTFKSGKVCMRFTSSGLYGNSCPYGQKCNFSHDAPPLPNWDRAQRLNHWKESGLHELPQDQGPPGGRPAGR